MVSARVILASSTIVAAAASGAFAYEVFFAEAIPSGGGSGSCGNSKTSEEMLFGFARFENDTSMALTVLNVQPTVTTGIEVVEILYIPWENLQSGGLGTGNPGDPENDRYGLTPVERVVVRPGEEISFVAHLRSTAPFGAATNFAIRYENGYGIPHTAIVSNHIGFAAIDPDADEDDSDYVSPCDAVYDYEG